MCVVGLHMKTNIQTSFSIKLLYLQFSNFTWSMTWHQNYKIWSGQISKMATITKNSKNNKINFFSRTSGYFWLNFGMEYQWTIPHRNKVQKRHNILCLFCTFNVPFDRKYKKGIPFMYPSDNLDNFPCTFCVPLSNLVIF